jgi:hypothetical protein
MKIPKVKIGRDASIVASQAEVLSEEALSLSESLTIGSEDNPLRRAMKALDVDYLKPLASPTKILPGDLADSGPLLSFLKSSEQDLKTIERTSNSFSELLRRGHNTISTKENGLIAQLKTLRERISALKLYSFDTSGNNEIVRYSFGEGTRLVSSEDSCSIDMSEGILTLPISSVSKIQPIGITVEEGSVGSLGNSLDRTRELNNNLLLALDGNDNTWVEFESFSNDSSGGLCKLVLKLSLKEPTVLNKITINPAVVGTSAWVQVEDIQLNLGEHGHSLKDQLQNKPWTGDLNPLILSPANTRYAGQGLFSFPPRLVDSVYIAMSQSSGQPVRNGRNYRYCIGIREIELLQIEYAEEGTFYFEPMLLNKPALAVGLIENIIGDKFGDYTITYSLSYDGGSTWNEVTSLDNYDSSLVEALFFPRPSNTLIIKGRVKRRAEAFAGDRTQDPSSTQIEERLVSVGGSVSSSIGLPTKPISFLEVIRAGLADRGSRGGTYLGTASSPPGMPETFRLPLKLERDFEVLVDNVAWPVVGGFANENTRGVLYNNSATPPMITFGNGTLGLQPRQGAEIYLRVKALQTPIMEEVSGSYSIQLEEQADKIKGLTKVFVRDPLYRTNTLSIGPGANKFILPEGTEPLTWGPSALSSAERTYIIVDDEVAFVDGYSEFLGLAGLKYSVDLFQNELFVNTPQGSDESNLTLTYFSKRRIEVLDKDWRFDNEANSILSSSSSLTPRIAEKLVPVSLASRVLELVPEGWGRTKYTIVKNSLTPINLNGLVGISRTLSNEIPYINGASEFEPYTGNSGGFGYYSVNYKEAKVHLPPQEAIANFDRGFLPGKLTYKYIALEVSYGLGEKLILDADYKVKEGAIELTPSLIRRLAGSLRGQQGQAVAHVRYDSIGAQAVSGSVLEAYSSPVIRDMAIIAVSSDPRLSTLERI